MSLVEDNLDLVAIRAKMVARTNWREYVTSGYIGLCRAASLFDPNRGAAFRSYARNRIDGEIREQMRNECGCRAKKRGRDAKFEPLHDFLSVEAIDEVADRDWIDWAADGLAPTDAAIVRTIAEGGSKSDAARALDIDPSGVSHAIRDRLRPALAEKLGVACGQH